MAQWTLFGKRQHQQEWMDQPTVSVPDFVQALYDIQWVNRNLAGAKTIIDEIRRVILLYPRQECYSVLDIGTGSADIPRALCDWGRRHNIMFSVVALDNHPVAVDVAKHLSANYPEINVVQGDALSLDYPPESFDLVISSMFLHHFDTVQAILLLKKMATISRLGFIINDLERHPLAWMGIFLLARLFNKGKLFRHDAPLSVLNGFRVHELQALIDEADLIGAQIYRRQPYRLALVYLKNRLMGNYPHEAI